ncbi:MAG: hypothetical protein ACK4UX_08800 [Thiobacillus sp.]
MDVTELPPLDEFVDLRDLLGCLRPAYATEHSVRWFVRRHRDALAASGALIIVAGRMRFHPQRFKATAVELGRRAAA